ncbi:hypothetical protein ACGFNU_45780 [Spirillospora sp. NPDC048911]|uniref:hypothetical protein n=1 Tax=Spirillospora sp. NPDC048911 TaxID=3364527 RepID=UPI0037184FDE
MIRSLSKLGDRLLDRLAPSTKASADPGCWREYRGGGVYECCPMGGITYCKRLW